MTTSVGKEKLKLYEAALCSPGMGDVVKISFSLMRKDVLLLSRLINYGLSNAKEDADGILSLIPKGSLEGLQSVADEILKKGGLTEFNEKLKEL